MIEVSHETHEALDPSRNARGSLVNEALENLGRLNRLKRNEDFQWFFQQVRKETETLEQRMFLPRLVADEALPFERLKILEWRRFLSLLERKEAEARGILERYQTREER